MIENERSCLLVSFPETNEAQNSKNLEGKEPRGVENNSRLVVLMVSVGLAVALSIHLSTSSQSTRFASAAQGQAWDETFDLWEASLYTRANHNNMDLANVELLGESKDSSQELIYFNHSKAFSLLKTHGESTALDFYYYQQGWEAQINQAYCGVATSAAFLNSLRGTIELPQDPVYDPFPWATQNQLILNECVRETLYDVDKMQHVFIGIGMDMAEQLLNCNIASQGYVAEAYHVDPQKTSAKEVRDAIKGALMDKDSRVGINYDRGGIGQGDMGHGHFSPIAAYNHEKDAFLVMDVAKYKYAPVWVPTSKLMGGIGSVDNCANFRYPDSPPDFFSTISFADFAQSIGCKPAFRGFIIISPTD
jgi:hypothetical protein